MEHMTEKLLEVGKTLLKYIAPPNGRSFQVKVTTEDGVIYLDADQYRIVVSPSAVSNLMTEIGAYHVTYNYSDNSTSERRIFEAQVYVGDEMATIQRAVIACIDHYHHAQVVNFIREMESPNEQ